MYCVVEGADNSGKTTLCEFLSAELGVSLVHSGGPPKSQEELRERVIRLCDHAEPVIFDRHPVISDSVYGPVLRSVQWVTPSMRLMLKSRRPVIVYCRPPSPVLLQEHRAKGGEDPAHIAAVHSNAFRLMQAYDQAMTNYDFLFYDWTAGGLQFRRLLAMYLGRL